MSKFLFIRFSAIGDVAMSVPVIYSFAVQYPEHEITVLSKSSLASLFAEKPANVSFFGVDVNHYKGIAGLNKLYKELKAMQFDYVADLHNVIRTKYLGFRFKLDGIPVSRIFKNRIGKRKLVRRFHKELVNQKSSFRRYEDTLKELGFPMQLNFTSIYGDSKGDLSLIKNITGDKGGMKWLGIAPFAKHKGKIYPIEMQEKVVAYFAGRDDVKVFLFGSGKEEEDIFNSWIRKYPSLVSVIGKLKMNTELILMSHLNVMLSMDSANMHLASLVNTPVVSVWGATHPYCGFMGWKQSPMNAVQVDLPCRPCSIFGQKKCYRKDYACLNMITPEMIIHRIEANF